MVQQFLPNRVALGSLIFLWWFFVDGAELDEEAMNKMNVDDGIEVECCGRLKA